MEKPVYYTSKSHRTNYKRLLAKVSNNISKEMIAACYILAGIGTIEDADQIDIIENHVAANEIDFAAMLETVGLNPAYRALIKLAANLYNSDNYANVNNTFFPLNDEYQAIAYQALLIKFPSFSKSFENSYYLRKEN